MGYTHSWIRPKEIAPAAFSNIVADFNQVLPYLGEAGVRLADGHGEGEPRINEDEVWFNGLEKCGHPSRDLGITWPAKDARGVSPPNPKAPLAQVVGEWFAGALLGSRTCGGDCSHETLYFPRVLKPSDWQKPENGGYFDFCKTAYKPYDLAVTAFLVIAKHHLGEKLIVSSDSNGLEQWQDAIRLCQAVLGYGEKFRLRAE